MTDAHKAPDHAALLKRSLAAIDQLQAKLKAVERARHEPIAIVGIGCRFPGESDTPAAFWELLQSGRDAVTEVPSYRWDVDKYFDPDPDAPGKSYTRWGGFIGPVDGFDAQFFGISPREAVGLDPQQRLLLEVTWESLEHAGIAPSSLAGSQTAVYMGITTSDYANRQIEARTSRHGDAYTPSGTAHSVAAGRLSYFLGLHGPNVAIDTACSSSLVAIHSAVQSLRNGEADLALAGGVNLTLTPDGAILTSRARMMSFDGRCKTFDASADGYVRGEGCGVLVLKRLCDAERDGDRVLALVRGSALNQDGRSSGLTVPNGNAQEAVIRAALANARVKPGEISYVETHGTGTSLGDPIEVKALNQVYGERAAAPALMLGSVKTNIGHLEAAAGVAGVIKTVLALQHRTIPPHLHLRTPNPLITWDAHPITVPTTPTAWSHADDAPRRAAVSSFGFSGTNAHLVLEEAPRRTRAVADAAAERPHQLVVLSAQTAPALVETAQRVGRALGQAGHASLADIAATLALGRSSFGERLAFVADGVDDLRAKLAAVAAGDTPAGVSRGRCFGGAAPELVFMFTGQGAQHAGMGRQLYESEPVFAAAMDACDAIVSPRLARGLLSTMFATGADADALDDTANTQPALFAIEYSLAMLWRSWGVEPTAVMGHSVGEYVAACIAGVFSLEDGLMLIAERGRLMGRLPREGSMAAVFADEATVDRAIADHRATVSIAAANGPQNTVISGRSADVDTVLKRLAATGIDSRPLNVSHAFHSPLMEPILDEFTAAASRVNFAAPRIELVSNVSGRLAGDEIRTPAYWRRHLREAVRFEASILTLQKDGYRVFLEVGPTPTLTGLAQRDGAHADSTWVASLRKGRADTSSMLEALGQLHVRGVKVDWRGVLGAEAAQRRTELPTYPFQRERYWIDFAEATDAVQVRRTRSAHPLLGGRLSGPLHTFQSEVGVDKPAWVIDHRIVDVTLFPASGFLELAQAAAREVTGGDDIRLHDLVIREGLLLPQDGHCTVQVIACAGEVEGFDLQVFSRAPAEGGTPSDEMPWRLHLRGRVEPGQGATPARVDRMGLLPADAAVLDVARYYGQLEAQGAQYGPSFRCITEIRHRSGDVVGRVALAPELAAEAAALVVHPALLDACFQLMGAGLPWFDAAAGFDSGDDICVPVAIGGYTVFRGGVTEAWSHVKVRPVDGSSSLRAEIVLFDADGAPIAEVRGLELRRLNRAALRPAAARTASTDWAFETAWNAARATARECLDDPGRWAVLADADGVGAALAGRLREHGAAVSLIHRGDVAAPVADGCQVDAGDTAQIRRAIEEAGRDDARPLQGIVVAWGLTPPSASAVDMPGAIGGIGGIDDIDHIERGHVRLLGDLLHVAQALHDSSARLWLLTRGAQPVAGSLPDLLQAPVWGLGGVVASELAAMRAVRVDLDPVVRPDEAPLLFESVWSGDTEERVALRGGERHVARLVPASFVAPSLPVALEIPVRGSLDKLALSPLPRRTPGPGEVEIRVVATGLNFRDVLNALGMYPGDPGPLGNECAGVITAAGEGVEGLQVGDDVISMVDHSFATWVVARASLTVRKPACLTFAEAATIPVAFLTADYALRHLGRMKSGDRVLIHAITGGVGMAAAQIARRAGCEIFGTAGTPAKRALALAQGAHHVADSRSVGFAADVLRESNGQGVDIVLNSLAGELIPQSLGVLNPGGRFIEIGKTGIWDADRVARSFPAVQYHALYLGEVAAARPQFLRGMLTELLAGFEAGELTPLPRRIYPPERSEDAFRYMAQGHHVGKLVIAQHRVPEVLAEASYLVTGGLTGLGLLVARWLVDEGARNLVLVARRAPSTEARKAIEGFEARGVRVRVASIDVADTAELTGLLAKMAVEMPRLRGVVHAAGIVDDGLLPEQDMQRFGRVMAPKVRGAWNLHHLTLRSALDFFVTFSSGAALMGSPGQGNYAAANSFLDALAHRRRAQGQHALSINWGSWSEVGMAAAVGEQHRRRWAAMGLGMIAPEEGLRMLQTLLRSGRSPQIAAMPLVRSRLPAGLGSFCAALVDREPARRLAASAPAAAGLQILTRLREAAGADRPALLVSFLSEQVARVLALGASQPIDPQRSLIDMGMDSLMAMELRNRIQTALKARVAVADLLQGANIATLSDAVLGTLDAEATEVAAPVERAWEEGSL